MGLLAQDTCELFFDDMRVPSSALLGGESTSCLRTSANTTP